MFSDNVDIFSKFIEYIISVSSEQFAVATNVEKAKS